MKAEEVWFMERFATVPLCYFESNAKNLIFIYGTLLSNP